MVETSTPSKPPAIELWSRTRRLVLVALVFAAAVAARLPNLGESLWTDEVVYTYAMLGGKSLDWVLFHDVHPPLYALIIYGWIGVFGDGEIAVRMPSLLCGLASLVVLFVLARRWFGDHVALLAMLLMALSPPHIWYSQENKTNMLVLLVNLAAVWRLDVAWTTNRWRDWLWFAGAAALAFWSHAFSLFLFVTLAGWLGWRMLRPEGRTRLRGAALAIALAALSCLPLVLAFFKEGEKLERAYLRAFTPAEVYKFVLVYLGHGNTLRTVSPYAELGALFEQPAYLWLVDAFFALLIGLGLLAAWRRWRSTSTGPAIAGPERERSELLVACFLLPMVGLLFGSLIYPKIFVERSLLLVLPFFVMLIASGIGSLARRTPRRVVAAALLILNGVALWALWVAKSDEWTVYKQNPDWRGAVEHVVKRRTSVPSPVVPIVFTNPPATALYYLDRLLPEPRPGVPADGGPRVVIAQAKARDKPALDRSFAQSDIRVIFYVHNRYWKQGRGRLLNRYRRDPRYRFVATTRLKGLDVYEIHRAGP